MSDRTISVRLQAIVGGYVGALESAGRATDNLASRAERIDDIGKKATQTGGKLTRGLTVPIAGVGAAAIYTAGQYEASMREVQALTSASGTEMSKLGGLAKQMGADTQFSANEAAQAMTQLIKGGFDAEQTYAALPGVMQLAAAAGLDIASAADIATNVLSVFGLEVAELARVNDVLAQSANNSDTDVQELGEAIKYVGPIAKSAGLDVEQTSAILAVFAENGVRGSQAGTELRRSIISLLNPTEKTQGALDRLGVSTVDASGELLPMVDIIGQLHDAGATTADMADIFGDRVAGMAAAVTAGAEPLEKMTGLLEESGGVAQNLADAKMGGLTGAIEELKGSLETLAITAGEAGLSSAIQTLAGWFTSLTNTASEANPTLIRVSLGIAAIVAASGPAIWAFGKMAGLYGPVVTGARNLLAGLSGIPAMFGLVRTEGLSALSLLGAGLGPGAAVIAGLAVLGGLLYFAHKQAQEFRRSHLDAGTAAMTLAESANIATREISALNDEQAEAVISSEEFRKANEDALLTLQQFESDADKEAFIMQMGYEVVLRGGSAEEAVAQVKHLFDAAGLEIPADLSIGNIDDFDLVVDNAERTAQRVNAAFAELAGSDVHWTSEIEAELDNIARAANEAFTVGDIAGFVEILATAEEQLGGNATATNYLADKSLELTGVQGLSKNNTEGLSDALRELTTEQSSAHAGTKDLLSEIVNLAEETDGELTPAMLGAAAAQLGAGDASGEYAKQAGEVEGPTSDAAGAVAELEQELGAQGDAAEDAEQKLSDYLDTLRGSIDPFFAMASSLRDNEQSQFDLIKAQGDYDQALKEHGPNSLQAWDAGMKLADAQQRVAESAFDVTEASIRLKEGIDNGSISMEDANRLLWAWMDAGLIGAETARALAESFGVVAWQAGGASGQIDEVGLGMQELDGSTAEIGVTADTSAAETALLHLAGGLIRIRAMAEEGILTAGQAADAARYTAQAQQYYGVSGLRGRQADSDRYTAQAQRYGGGRAAGGSVSAGYSYDVGEYGPEKLHMAPGGGGFVEPSGKSFDSNPSATYSNMGAGFDDSRMVSAIAGLGRRLDNIEQAPLFGQYHVHGVEKPQSREELNADAKFAKTMVG